MVFLLDWSVFGTANGSDILTSGSETLGVTVASDLSYHVGDIDGSSSLNSANQTSDNSTLITFDTSVEDVSFEIFDIDQGHDPYSPSLLWDDQITLIARDAEGNIIPLPASVLSDITHHSVTSGPNGELVIDSEGNASPGIDGSGAADSISVMLEGPIASIEIIHQLGDDGAGHTGAIGVSNLTIGSIEDITVDGTSGDDTMLVGFIDNDNDTIDGADGDDDIIAGYAGNDTIEAGEGEDTIFGGTGNDDISGGNGNDIIFGEEDDDILFGGEGDDELYGGLYSDTLFGGAGSDDLYGGRDDDFFKTGAGDNAFGEHGDDVFTIDPGANDPYGTTPPVINIVGGETGEANQADNADTTNDNYPGAANTFGDVLDLTNLFSAGLLGPGDISFDDPSHESGHFTYTNDDGGLVTVNFSEIENVIVCFTRGTMIMTDAGEKAIEDLKAGHKVLTRDHGMQELRWIGSRKVPAMDKLAPIMIKAGAMANDSDLLVSPQHRMVIEGWKSELLFGEREVLAAAKHLVNNDTIYVQSGGMVEYFHLLFDAHEIVFANGAASESFHPGEEGMSALADDARDEIFDLFPELRDKVETYGPAARVSLKGHEAKVLAQNPDFLN